MECKPIIVGGCCGAVGSRFCFVSADWI